MNYTVKIYFVINIQTYRLKFSINVKKYKSYSLDQFNDYYLVNYDDVFIDRYLH